MPVFESGDLIKGELPATAASSFLPVGLVGAPRRRDDDSERRKLATGGYILGVAMKIPLFMSFCLPKSFCGPPTKSYPGH
jgi:hypothetical protein